jgi:hypothetical protein
VGVNLKRLVELCKVEKIIDLSDEKKSWGQILEALWHKGIQNWPNDG